MTRRPLPVDARLATAAEVPAAVEALARAFYADPAPGVTQMWRDPA